MQHQPCQGYYSPPGHNTSLSLRSYVFPSLSVHTNFKSLLPITLCSGCGCSLTDVLADPPHVGVSPHVGTVLLNHPGKVVLRAGVVLLRGPVCVQIANNGVMRVQHPSLTRLRVSVLPACTVHGSTLVLCFATQPHARALATTESAKGGQQNERNSSRRATSPHGNSFEKKIGRPLALSASLITPRRCRGSGSRS